MQMKLHGESTRVESRVAAISRQPRVPTAAKDKGRIAAGLRGTGYARPALPLNLRQDLDSCRTCQPISLATIHHQHQLDQICARHSAEFAQVVAYAFLLPAA